MEKLRKLFLFFINSKDLFRTSLICSACLIFVTGSYLCYRQQQYLVSGQKSFKLAFLPISSVLNEVKSHIPIEIQQKVKLAPTPTPKPDAQTIISNNALFTSKVMAFRNKTFVKITYKPALHPFKFWISLKTVEGTKPVSILIHHPLLDNLSWSHVTNVQYTLYQREPKYQSVEEFISSPPKDAVIGTDQVIIDQKIIAQNNIEALDDLASLENVDFILTTYHKPFEENGYLVSEAVVDASNGDIVNDELLWTLYMPGLSVDNPLKIKKVDIVYNQPGNIEYR